MIKISDRIKQGLSIRGMKQVDLVEKTKIGKSSISTYISGEYEPKQRNIYKIAKALDVSEAWLMGYDVPMGRDNEIKPLEQKTKYPSNALPTETEFVSIPILGSVSAGLGCLAENEIIGYEPWSTSSIKRGHDYIVLRVSGDSMFPSLIEDDLVLIQCQNTVDSGRIAVVTVNGDEGVIKKVKYGSDWIELHSINPMYPVRRFEGEDVQCINVMGLVVESKRKF